MCLNYYFMTIYLFGLSYVLSNPSTFNETTWHIVTAVTPTLVTANSTTKTTSGTKIVFNFQAAGRRYSLILRKNSDLLHPDYFEKYFSDDDQEIINTKRKSHCYYRGILLIDGASVSDAQIAGASCHGGISVDVHSRETASFSVDPHLKAKSLQNSHDIYFPLNYKVRNTRRKKRSIREPRMSNGTTRYIEMYIVNDNAQFRNADQNKDKVIERTLSIVNHINSIYESLNIVIALIGVEVWTRRDRMTAQIPNQSDSVMKAFLEYRKRSITPQHRHDNAQLLTGRPFEREVLGKGVVNVICSASSVAVSYDRRSSKALETASVVAHELGHNLGFKHINNDPPICHCDIRPEACRCDVNSHCIMAAQSDYKLHLVWSDCTRSQYANIRSLNLDICLRNIPVTMYAPPTNVERSLCGNGFVDAGEECDCGLECSGEAAKCCNKVTCKLTLNSTCSSGRCCDISTCKPKVKASLCRGVRDICDLPEHCDGTSELCPDDLHIQNNARCTTDSGDKAFCYEGGCRSQLSQCRMLWGRTGNNNLPCYNMNTKGTHIGGCVYGRHGAITSCMQKDITCGRLFCDTKSEKLMFWDQSIQYRVDEIIYKGSRLGCRQVLTSVPLDGATRDHGLVPNGSPCPQGVCLNSVCVGEKELSKDLCHDCNGRGVCNDKKECHCDIGYAPPFCKMPGDGGSISGGPLYIYKSNVLLTLLLLTIFVIVIPASIIAIFYIRWRYYPSNNDYKGNYSLMSFIRSIYRPPAATTATTTTTTNSTSHMNPRRPQNISAPVSVVSSQRNKRTSKIAKNPKPTRRAPPVPKVNKSLSDRPPPPPPPTANKKPAYANTVVYANQPSSTPAAPGAIYSNQPPVPPQKPASKAKQQFLDKLANFENKPPPMPKHGPPKH